jgi:hypothetical protein
MTRDISPRCFTRIFSMAAGTPAVFAQLLSAALLCFGLMGTAALAGSIDPSQPNRNGTDTFVLTPNGGGVQITVTTTQILTTTTPAGKAIIIRNAINATLGAGAASINPLNPTHVNVAGYVVNETRNGTAEGAIVVADAGGASSNYFASFEYGGSITGEDVFGNGSMFDASFGYNGLDVSASFDADTLPILTPDAVTTAMYNDLLADLPASLRSRLHLDLTDDQITFTFPTGQSSYFVNSFTTDTGIELDGGLGVTTPEPATLSLVASGFLLIAAGRLRRRKKAPQANTSSS